MAIKTIDADNVPLEEGSSVMSGQTFEEAAAEMPESASGGFGKVASSEPLEEGTELMEGSDTEPAPVKSIKMTRKMKAAMKKIQDRVVSAPLLYFKGKAIEHPEWALEPDEEEVIKESLSFVFDVLNIEFRIEQLNITLESIWWVFLYPVAAIGMIFVAKKSVVDTKYKTEEQEQTNAK